MKFPFFSKRNEQPRSATDDFWYSLVDIGRSTAGQRVTSTTAQKLSAVYACQTAIAESVAMLPAILMNEANERNKVKAIDNSLFDLLRHSPNSIMDSFVFFEMMQYNLLDSGNAYAFIERKRSGAVISLMPLPSERVTIKIEQPNNRVIYRYVDGGGKQYEYEANQIFHIKYKSKDGITGRSPIKVAAETFGFNLALLEHGNKLFENGAFLSGTVETDHVFKDDAARQNFMERLQSWFGARNAGKVMLLENGVKYSPQQMNNKDAQFAESKESGIIDIARIYRMPPVMIQCMDKGMSYASIEQLAIMYTQYTIQPWVIRWERALKHQLLSNPGNESLFVRFNISSLIRGDLKSRTESIIAQLQYGLKTINEARYQLDDNAVDSALGDVPMVSHNLRPLSDLEQKEEEETKEESKEESEEVLKSENDIEESLRLGNVDPIARFRPLLTQSMQKIINKEVLAAERALKRENFLAWADNFYNKHKGIVREILEIPVATCFGNVDFLDSFVETYINTRTEAILDNKETAFVDVDSDFWVNKLIGVFENANQ